MKTLTSGFGALRSILTWSTGDVPMSPTEEAPRLVHISKYPDNLPHRDSRFPPEIPPRGKFLDSMLDFRPEQTVKRKRARERLKDLLSHSGKRRQRTGETPVDPENYESKRCCTLCQREIANNFEYAAQAESIQCDNTYISTKCCHNLVHSSCYRTRLQHYIDSKGRPRCPICRDYPDIFVACWALGYIFDKDSGDMDDDECDCPADKVCEVCEGRKQLLRDMHPPQSRKQAREDRRKSERLATIDEHDQEG